MDWHSNKYWRSIVMRIITADMKVASVIRQCPETSKVFLGRGCPDMCSGFFRMMSYLMSVRNAARVHKIELEPPLLEDLNKTAQAEAYS
jgi:hypothetical protein